MYAGTTLTIVGNLAGDPELRFTGSGLPVANFRVASTPRQFDKLAGEYRDGEPLFLTCTAWRELAENLAESLHKGDRVCVSGTLHSRTYETKEGERRTVVELHADEVAASMKFATVTATRRVRSARAAAAS